jgi:DNA-binding CsgD family transcriptional regulator
MLQVVKFWSLTFGLVPVFAVLAKKKGLNQMNHDSWRYGMSDAELLSVFRRAKSETLTSQQTQIALNMHLLAFGSSKDGGKDGFTERQGQIFACLVQGLETKEIARRLGIAAPTVKVHLAAMYRSTGATSRTHLVAIVLGKPSPNAVVPLGQRDIIGECADCMGLPRQSVIENWASISIRCGVPFRVVMAVWSHEPDAKAEYRKSNERSGQFLAQHG